MLRIGPGIKKRIISQEELAIGQNLLTIHTDVFNIIGKKRNFCVDGEKYPFKALSKRMDAAAGSILKREYGEEHF